RTSRADFGRWETQLANTGHCRRPVRLRGRIDAIDLATGETAPVYTTGAEPDGVLLVACGNRREAVCPPCSAVYKRDARQLVRAGLAGGKGIPQTVAAHPCVFATFTAPSFGPVHSRRTKGSRMLACRPRRDAHARRCPHGRDISCPHRHADDDPRLGRPLCPDCYDYAAAVLFNARAGDLWRRFTTYLPRHLAALTGRTVRALRSEAAIRYVKVAEYQARGVVHYHAVIRLDAPGDSYQPPPPWLTASLLCQAIKAAATAVAIATGPEPGHPGIPARTLRFGAQTDTRPIRHHRDLPGTGGALDGQAVASYIAKYATKTLDVPGLADRTISTRLDIEALRCSRHHKQMIATAWEVGGGQLTAGLRPSRLCRWAHQLGHGGHFLTKSRRYSVTFGELRRARTAHRRAQRHPGGERDPWGRPLDDTVVLVLATWAYAGTGYATTPGAALALASADRARSR
ncbi:MAG TPA: replication initiator, partial [Streptosporangiaceae bacterium]|nr:replication initiator [Streptosporangiaceae bacterium]